VQGGSGATGRLSAACARKPSGRSAQGTGGGSRPRRRDVTAGAVGHLRRPRTRPARPGGERRLPGHRPPAARADRRDSCRRRRLAAHGPSALRGTGPRFRPPAHRRGRHRACARQARTLRTRYGLLRADVHDYGSPGRVRGGLGDPARSPEFLPQGSENRRIHHPGRFGAQSRDWPPSPAVQGRPSRGAVPPDDPTDRLAEWKGAGAVSPVVILTALDLEYQAVRERLADLRLHRHSQGTLFEMGRLGGGRCQLVLAHVGKGNLSAAVLAERAIAEFRPAALLFVGVAGALHAHIALGDVVVATHVYAFHGGTSEDGGFKSRPRVWETSHAADQIAQHLHRTGTWAGDLNPRPQVHFGPIAAGEVV